MLPDNQSLNTASDMTALADGLKLLAALEGVSRAEIGRRALVAELRRNRGTILAFAGLHYKQRAAALKELLDDDAGKAARDRAQLVQSA